MILSDRSIREELAAGRIVIDPLDETSIQPSSVDLHLDRYFRVFRNHTTPVIDVKQDLGELTALRSRSTRATRSSSTPASSCSVRRSSGSACPTTSSARIEGKSSLGRLGLLIHSTAGFVDPGFDGHVTLELSNVASLPITLVPGDDASVR